MLVPGLTVIPPVAGVPQRPIEPNITQGVDNVYCVDTLVTPGAFPNGGAIPLSITLVWTDPTVAPTAAQQLVNNLDLFVIPPTGPRATGNSGNSSMPGQGPDTINNIEKITFAFPSSTLNAAGQRQSNAYEVVVRATLVPQGPQSYSLVITGPGLQITTTAGQGGCPAVAPPAPSGGGGAAAGAAIAIDGSVPATTFISSVAALAAAVVILAAVAGYLVWRGGPAKSDAGSVRTTNALSGVSLNGPAQWGEGKGAVPVSPTLKA
jgi:hypothetical protein